MTRNGIWAVQVPRWWLNWLMPVAVLVGVWSGVAAANAQGEARGLRLHREWTAGQSDRLYAICDEGNGTMVYLSTFGEGSVAIQPGGCKR